MPVFFSLGGDQEGEMLGWKKCALLNLIAITKLSSRKGLPSYFPIHRVPAFLHPPSTRYDHLFNLMLLLFWLTKNLSVFLYVYWPENGRSLTLWRRQRDITHKGSEDPIGGERQEWVEGGYVLKEDYKWRWNARVSSCWKALAGTPHPAGRQKIWTRCCELKGS